MRFVNLSIGKKWREFRRKLWEKYYDPTLSEDDIINNVPQGVDGDQWTSYVKYRLRPDTMVQLHLY